MLIYQRSRGSKLWGRFGKLASLEISLMKMHKLELKIYNFSLIKWPNRVLMPPNPQFWGNKDFKVPKLGGFRRLNNHTTKTDT